MRVTVSLPDNVAKRLFEESKRSGLKVSQIVKTSLEERMEIPDENIKVTPTVLWKLRGRRYPRGPSPTIRKGRYGYSKIVDLDEVKIQRR